MRDDKKVRKRRKEALKLRFYPGRGPTANRQSGVRQYDIRYDNAAPYYGGTVYGKLTVNDGTGEYTLTASYRTLNRIEGSNWNDAFVGHAHEVTELYIWTTREDAYPAWIDHIGPLTIDNSGHIHGKGVLTPDERAWLDTWGRDPYTMWHIYTPDN